jgi:hypothetical protein
MTTSRSRSVQLAAAALLAASVNVAAAGTGTASGCGHAERPGNHQVALASMVIKTPLYVIQRDGKFSKVELDPHRTTLISDHGFDSMPTMRPSADGRWVSYSGVLRERDKTQYWLYDRQDNTDRLILEHPAWGGGIPDFSPDGRYLAIAASYDSRWGSIGNAGVYLFDTATSSMQSVEVPMTIAPRNAWASTTWSKDGNELLIMVRSMAVTDQREYFSYRVATKRLEKLSGYYNSSIHEDVFKRQRKEIPLFPAVSPRSNLGQTSAVSPDGQWRAYLGKEKADGTYPLNVVGKDRVIRQAALGRYEHCMGKTIYITGWLDDHHLAYRVSALSYFVYDAQSGRTAELFGDHVGPSQFTW